MIVNINNYLMDLKEFIKSKRPNISNSSLTTYNSILTNLHKKIFETKDVDIDNFEDSKKVINYLKDLEPNKRKTILSALVVITDKKDYRELMLEDIKDYNEKESKQVKNEKQEESWVNDSEIKEVYNKLEKRAKLLYKKDNKTMTDLQDIQDYVIIALLGGILIPPRRSKDYVDFKIRNIDKDKDNYKDKNILTFNSYKTAKTYGTQRIKIPIKLNNILNKWIKMNDTDYLLYDANKHKLTNVKLNQRLNKIFDRKAGVNQLRHTYLSHKYGDTINDNINMVKDMEGMGTSKLQEKIYIKK